MIDLNGNLHKSAERLDAIRDGFFVFLRRMKKKLLVVDDHEIVRKGVINYLKGFFTSMEFLEASNMSETISLIELEKPDLIILDLNLPDSNAEGLVLQVKKASQHSPIVVFSMFPEDVMKKPMTQLGISQYVNKGSNLAKLKDAVNWELNNHQKTRQDIKKEKEPSNPFAVLSPQELSVMFALLEGHTNKSISKQLQIGQSTVATYKQRILEKLMVSSTAEMIKLAVQFNLYHLSGR
jgi:DNA-binding NarL/FixJ family response regulator